jgi:hypothetical protein
VDGMTDEYEYGTFRTSEGAEASSQLEDLEA